MAIFYDGALRHTFVLPLGGGNITADVAVGLRIPAADAESLKIASGCAAIQKVRRDELVELPGVVEVVNSPTFATAVGLALYGAKLAESGMGRAEEEAPGGWMARVKQILSEFF